IRHFHVTGVQTCALPISTWLSPQPRQGVLLTLHWEVEADAEAPAAGQVSAYREDGSAAAGSPSLGGLVADSGVEPAALQDRLADMGPVTAARAACLLADYPAALADRPLGDLDESGEVDVRDALLAAATVVGGPAADDLIELFHADLTGDCDYDEAVVRQAFLKAALPDAPAAPVAKPLVLTYARMRADEPVIVGNAGRLPLQGLAF